MYRLIKSFIIISLCTFSFIMPVSADRHTNPDDNWETIHDEDFPAWNNDKKKDKSKAKLEVKWLLPQPDTKKGEFTLNGKMVIPVRWNKKQMVNIDVKINGGWTKKNTAQGKVTLTVINTLTKKQAIVAKNLSINASGTARYPLELATLLNAVKLNGPNQGVLRLQASYQQMPRSVSAYTKKNLYPMLRRVVVLLPGAPGSTIDLKGKDAASFPNLNVLKQFYYENLLWLKSDRNGNPVNDASKLTLFQNLIIGLAHAYDTSEFTDLYDPKDHPVLKQGNKVIPYYILIPWPYDWRLHLEKHVNILTGSASGKDKKNKPTHTQPYAVPPSLNAILKAEKKLDKTNTLNDKAVMVSHSAGGLILRSALSKGSFVKQVERAFFITVPFYGSPKTYDVFLTGDMGIQILNDKAMQKIIPNIPIFYYLSPSRRYPDTVLIDRNSDGTGWVKFDRTIGAGEIMKRAIAKARHYNIYPHQSEVDGWNKKLESDAKSFHSSLPSASNLAAKIPIKVFWSSNESKKDTLGGLRLVPLRGTRYISSLPTYGDKTVPTVSQKADWSKKELIKIPGNPEHLEAVIDPFVWKSIVNIIHTEPPK